MSNVIPYQLTRDGLGKVQRKDRTTTTEQKKGLLKSILGDDVSFFVYKTKRQKILTGTINTGGKVIYFTLSDVTYMGGDLCRGADGRWKYKNPIDLKRIQLQPWFKDFYHDYSGEDSEIKFLGVYSYGSRHIFVDFRPETYVQKSMNHASAHVWLNDLYEGLLQAEVNSFFHKIDKNENHIYVINETCFANYLRKELEETNVLSVIKNISSIMPWGREIMADESILFMYDLQDESHTNYTGFKNWKQNMWNGWLMEAYYSLYQKQNDGLSLTYLDTCQDKDLRDEYKHLDLDLLLSTDELGLFLGDIKGISISVNGKKAYGKALLNDESHVNEALERFGRIWFVIYLQDSKSGKTDNFSMVKRRNEIIREKTGEEVDLMSAPGTPHSIRLKEVIVLSMTPINKDRFFFIGKQPGANSNGKDRPFKYKVGKNTLRYIEKYDNANSDQEYPSELVRMHIDDDALVVYRWKEEDFI